MKIKRSDGTTAHFEIVHHGRARWACNLVAVDDDNFANCYGDPVYRTLREARAAARKFADKYAYVRGLGWCIP